MQDIQEQAGNPISLLGFQLDQEIYQPELLGPMSGYGKKGFGRLVDHNDIVLFVTDDNRIACIVQQRTIHLTAPAKFKTYLLLAFIRFAKLPIRFFQDHVVLLDFIFAVLERFCHLAD